MIQFNIVPLIVESQVSAGGKYAHLKCIESCVRYVKRAHSTIHHRWNKYSFKVEKSWKFLDVNSRLSEGQSSISQMKFCGKLQVCCTLCSQALSHRRITPLLRWPEHSMCPENAYNYSGFHVRLVFQVGHHSELPQLCSFCAYAHEH